MKKGFAILLSICILLGCFSGCGTPAKQNKTSKLHIVTTIFPEYDWVRQIIGDEDTATVTMLLDNGVDLHSYQPTADDIIKISTCDMFIYVGGESDEWVDDALQEAINKKMIVINLLEVLGDQVKTEEIKEGMEAEDEEAGEEEEPENDEHVWLSLRNAAALCSYISARLCEIDSDHAAAYKANTDAYVAALNALDAKYTEAVGAAKTKTLLFGDRFPCRYLTEDYGLDYYAAFVGCSAETEASFETILFLANKADALGLPAIIQLESSDGALARTIQQTTKTKDQRILTFDSLQSVTSADAQNGTTYLSAMEQNLNVLKDALQ